MKTILIIAGSGLSCTGMIERIMAMQAEHGVAVMTIRDDLQNDIRAGEIFKITPYNIDNLLIPRDITADDHIEYTILPYRLFRAINKAIPFYKRRWILFCQLNFK